MSPPFSVTQALLLGINKTMCISIEPRDNNEINSQGILFIHCPSGNVGATLFSSYAIHCIYHILQIQEIINSLGTKLTHILHPLYSSIGLLVYIIEAQYFIITVSNIP